MWSRQAEVSEQPRHITRQDGRMCWVSVFHFGRLLDSNSWVWTPGKSNRWLENWFLSLSSQVLGIIRIEQGLVGSVQGALSQPILGWLSADCLASQWGSTIKSPWVRTFTSWYSSWYGMKLKQPTKAYLVTLQILDGLMAKWRNESMIICHFESVAIVHIIHVL